MPKYPVILETLAPRMLSPLHSTFSAALIAWGVASNLGCFWYTGRAVRSSLWRIPSLVEIAFH